MIGKTLILTMAGLLSQVAFAQTQSFHCRVRTGDVGVIATTGATKVDAVSHLREECTDRRVAAYEKARGPIDSDRLDDFIDSCINLECE